MSDSLEAAMGCVDEMRAMATLLRKPGLELMNAERTRITFNLIAELMDTSATIFLDLVKLVPPDDEGEEWK